VILKRAIHHHTHHPSSTPNTSNARRQRLCAAATTTKQQQPEHFPESKMKVNNKASTITALVFFIGLSVVSSTTGPLEATSWASASTGSISKKANQKHYYYSRLPLLQPHDFGRTTAATPALSSVDNNGDCSLMLSSQLRGGAAAAVVTKRSTIATTSASAPSALLVRLKVGFYFALWYALNIIYNSKFCARLISGGH
jgi:hypothetical protein